MKNVIDNFFCILNHASLKFFSRNIVDDAQHKLGVTLVQHHSLHRVHFFLDFIFH
jgi:hypothetical protein